MTHLHRSTASALAGILSVDQAAQFLGSKPAEVQRLIAHGTLADNRNATASVFMRHDLEAFIGRGKPGLKSLNIRGGWFTNDPTFIDRAEFQQRIRRHAGDLAEVSDEQLENAPRGAEFRCPPTREMVIAFRSDATAGTFGGRNRTSGISVGVAAIAGALRSEAASIINRQSRTGLGATPAIDTLFATPKSFSRIVEKSKAALSGLDVVFNEKRTVPGNLRPINVTRRVRLAALSADLESDVRQAIELAF